MSKLLKRLICCLFVSLFIFSLASCIEFVPTVSPDNGNNGETSIKDNYNCISIAEAIQLATEAGDTGTTEKYYVYGTIKEVSNGMYGEMTITDGTDELYIYGVYSNDETTRYDAMTEKPVAGDEVVLFGMLKTYSSKPEMDRGYLQVFRHIKVEVDDTDYILESISEARELEEGKKVKLTGVVAQITYAFGMVPNGFYLIDSTGSIYIYGNEVAASVSKGNTITIIGEKTYYVLASEQANAEKFGYKGCCQLQNATIIENDNGNLDYNKSWIKTSTVKDILDTPITENITTNIYKVNALVKKVEGTGFNNYYFNDLDGITGTYVYTACSGSDFTWLDEFDGKICTVYLSPINAKSTTSGCFYRFIPIEVNDEGYKFNSSDAPKYVLTYHAESQFLDEYEADPATELLTSVSNDLINITDVKLTYTSSNENTAYFEEVEGKVIFHVKNAGTAEITITATYGEYSDAITIVIVVSVPITYETITVKEAFDTVDGEEVIVKGIVASSLVNQSGFYLIDETGVIAVKAPESEVALLSSGDEVIIKGIKGHQQKANYTGTSIGQNNIYNAEILVNYYGNHNYSTATFKNNKTVEELSKLDPAIDYSGDVYVVEAIISVKETNYYTSIAITGLVDSTTTMSLYCSNAGQYEFLKPYANQTVTLELAMCNWNSKNYYTGCVISVTKDGVKTINTLNFND